MKKVKVRGIYSTALTKLLLDLGYKVSLPSDKQRERFSGLEEGYPIDAYISDNNLWVSVTGPSSREIVERISEEIECLYTRDFVGRIYRGDVIGKTTNGYLLRVGKFIGILNEPLLSERPLVQIKKFENGFFQLTQDIRIFGKYIVLIKDGRNSFSKEFPEEEKEKFSDIKIDGFGIYFTKFSIGREKEEVMEDIRECLKKYEELESLDSLFFDHSWKMKFTKKGNEKLDEIRSSVSPTCKKHHLIRKLGLDGSLDIVEEIDPNRIDVLERENTSMKLRVIHDKLIGEGFEREETVLERKDGYVRSYREIKSLGFYDGLRKRKLPGDYAISEIKEGEVYYRISYYRRDGSPIGEYINLNTPIEMFGTNVYYIDLGMDLVKVDDRWMLIDVEEFEVLLEEFPSLETYKKILFEKVREITGGNYEVEGS